MNEVLIRASKRPWEPLSAEETLRLGALAKNAGNLLFGESVYRTLSTPSAAVTPDRFESHRIGNRADYISMVNESYSHFVIPLANAFRPAFRSSLRKLTRLVSRLHIPVTVIGVGSQHKMGDSSSNDQGLRDDVSAFMSAVLDRSASVGVRGEYTASFLHDLGFGEDHVDVIGCPSVFMNGRPRPVEKSTDHLSTESPIAMTVSPYVSKLNAIVKSHTQRYPRLMYIPQNHSDLNMMVWGEDRSHPKNMWNPTHTKHPLYVEDRMRFPLDPRTWTDYLSDFDFLFGSRIHGTIAGILAGVPSLLLVHDSRTLELAEYHSIPHVKLSELGKDADAAELFERTDYSSYNARQSEVLDSYIDFLEKNGLEHIFREGNDPVEFDQQLARADLPPMVNTLFAKGDDGRFAFLDRVNDLHDEQERLGREVESLARQVAAREEQGPRQQTVAKKVRSFGRRILRRQ